MIDEITEKIETWLVFLSYLFMLFLIFGTPFLPIDLGFKFVLYAILASHFILHNRTTG